MQATIELTALCAVALGVAVYLTGSVVLAPLRQVLRGTIPHTLQRAGLILAAGGLTTLLLTLGVGLALQHTLSK